jgi:hypothetical protein
MIQLLSLMMLVELAPIVLISGTGSDAAPISSVYFGK